MRKIFIILICTILLAGNLFGCTKKADNIKENTDLHSLESIKDEDETTKISDELQKEENQKQALNEIKDELKMLTGLDDIETSMLYDVGDIYYIKAKIHNLELENIFTTTEEGSYPSTVGYRTPYSYTEEENNAKDFYEVWRYEKGDLKRILFNISSVRHDKNDDGITINGDWNSYYIRVGIDSGKEKVLYECHFTKILEKEKYTCYINDFFSVCVVDNEKNEILLNKYTERNNEEGQFTEDFVLDNNRAYFGSRYTAVDTDWITDSNIFFYACYDIANVFYIVDIDKKIAYEPCKSINASSHESFIDRDKGYILTGTTFTSIDMDGYMKSLMQNKNYYLYLINLYTSEICDIGKSVYTQMYPIKEDDNTISYLLPNDFQPRHTMLFEGKRIKVDISDMIGKDRGAVREKIIKNIIPRLKENYIKTEAGDLIISENKNYMTIKGYADEDSFRQSLIYCDDKNDYTVLYEKADSIKIIKWGEFIYADIYFEGNRSLIQYDVNNNQNTVADNVIDINLSESNKYMSIYRDNGDIVILDEAGNKYMDFNAYDYIYAASQGGINVFKDSTSIGLTSWSRNDEKLYILTKKDDKLDNMFEINIADKSVKDLAYDIDCHYEDIHIDFLNGYAVYITYEGENYNEDVFLYIKYFDTGETVELARTKGKKIYFYLSENGIEYYSWEDQDRIGGVYTIKY